MAVPDTRLNLLPDGWSFSARAYQTISGGQWVKAMSGDAVLTGTNDLGTVIAVDLADARTDDYITVGVAANTVASGALCSVLRRGIHGFKAGAAIATAGVLVQNAGDATADSVISVPADTGSKAVGRVLTTGASGQLVPVALGW